MTSAYSPHKITSLRPLNDTVIVEEMEFSGRQLSSGIVLLNDNGTTAGIRPRWGRVYAIGPTQTDVQIGQWICVAHGRWTRGVRIEDQAGEKTIRKVDPKDILLISNDKPNDDTLSDAVQASQMSR